MIHIIYIFLIYEKKARIFLSAETPSSFTSCYELLEFSETKSESEEPEPKPKLATVQAIH